jgi:hypothetical protein
MEIKFKVKKKSIVREVMESYRELPSYKYALLDIYCVIEGVLPNTKKCRYLDDANDAFMLEEILKEVAQLKSRLQKLEQGNNQGENGNNYTCNR